MMIAQFNTRTNSDRLSLRRHLPTVLLGVFVLTVLAVATVSAQSVLPAKEPVAPELPGSAAVAFSLFRVLGALAIVLAVFFGGLWLFRNWQRVLVRNGRPPRLNILELKSLGQRQALYVVGYERQRMLIASSPAGITMLTNLSASDVNTAEEESTLKPSFTDALRQAIQRKS
jgi:flagellar biogenesis protein FliO